MGTDISMTEHLLTSCLPKYVSAQMDPGALAKDGFHNIKEFVKNQCLVNFKVKKKNLLSICISWIYKVEHYPLFKNSSHLLFYELLTYKMFFNCQKNPT